ncbi:MAG: PIG-L family deacetylase [Chloroflexi bacterium]|nr:MAG: PIG-L family deacetylase [Chloroflexota bacterium]
MERVYFEIPNLYDAIKILAVQPHYDDLDILAGGTVAALAEAGAEIVYLTCTNDLVGVIDDTWSDEEAAARLKNDQEEAARVTGVRRQYWLGYPDAGAYNYFDLRRDILRVMRIESPDTIITVDPWTAYEAHTDHIQCGKAAAEAAILCGLTKVKSEPRVDAAYQPHQIERVAFYGTQYPNTCFDISRTIEKKKQAIRCYHAQYHEQELEQMAGLLEYYAKMKAQGQDMAYAEMWKVVTPRHLHGYPDAWKF